MEPEGGVSSVQFSVALGVLGVLVVKSVESQTGAQGLAPPQCPGNQVNPWNNEWALNFGFLPCPRRHKSC
jgi:hypothetical protein